MGVLKTKSRTPPWPPYPAWSTSKWWAFIRSKLRSGYTRWPPRFEVLNNARRKYEGKSKAQKWEFQCAICDGWFKQKDVNVDHIEPCGALNSFEDLPGFVERLFCGVEGLQVTCKECHKAKTNEERRKKT